MSNKEKQKYCLGCRNDRYNHPGTCERPGIDAPVISKECWHLSNSKIVKKAVYFRSSQIEAIFIKTLNCFSPYIF